MIERLVMRTLANSGSDLHEKGISDLVVYLPIRSKDMITDTLVIDTQPINESIPMMSLFSSVDIGHS